MRQSPSSDPATTSRRTRYAWYVYDLGNTTVEFAIPLYLTICIVEDLGVAAMGVIALVGVPLFARWRVPTADTATVAAR